MFLLTRETLFIVTGDVTDGTTISQRTLTASLLLYVLWWGCCSGGRQGRGGRVLVLVSDELTHRTSRLSDRGRYNGREMTSPDKKTRQGCRGEIEMAPTLWNPNDWTGLQYFYFITFYSYFSKIYLKLCCPVRPKAHGRPLPQSKEDKTTDSIVSAQTQAAGNSFGCHQMSQLLGLVTWQPIFCIFILITLNF